MITTFDMIKDILDFCLGVMYFKMIQNFVTKFTLHTQVDQDGNIDIVGIDDNGAEVFKFELNDE